MPVYFIHQADVSGTTLSIGPPLVHHLIRVLRYRVGDALTLVDETRKKYGAKISAVASHSISLDILWEEEQKQTVPHLRLGVALIKGNRIDWVIEKATELGVAQISPIYTRRVVVKKSQSHQTDHQQKRWKEIAKEAAQQSERWDIPIIDRPMTCNLFLEQTQSYDFKLIAWETESVSSTITKGIGHAHLSSLTHGAILIGPEGGWEQEEVDCAKARGYCSISLGDRPLRADTAAIAIISILQNELHNANGRANNIA